MNILTYFKFGNWGDTIGKYWIGEYIKEHLDVNIYINTKEIEGEWKKWIEFPWAKSYDPENINMPVDYHIATHHRHWWWGGTTVPGAGLPLYFDLHGFNFRMVYEGWYPKLIPTNHMIEEFKKLKLPDKYNVIHLNDQDIYKRSLEDPRTFWMKFKGTTDTSIPVVSTGVSLDAVNVNLKQIPGWLKIYVMYKAENLYGSHTGFTSIASIYRRRKKSYLVNYVYPRCLFVGPPVVAFGNCSYQSPDYKKLYYIADFKFDWERYKEFNEQDKSIRYFINESQYPSLKLLDFDIINDPPESYDPLPIDMGRENCLVPANTKFAIDNKPYINLIPNYDIAWGGSWFGSKIV